MFKIGDEVICIQDNCWCEKDDWGIVTGFSNNKVCVDFKQRIEGNCILYISPEHLQLKNQSNIKPEDMISGEWYIVESDYLKEKHLIKFGYIKKTDIYTTAPFGYSYTRKFIHGDSRFSSAADKYNSIIKATKEEVLKYFPDEFKEPMLKYIKCIKDGIGYTKKGEIYKCFEEQGTLKWYYNTKIDEKHDLSRPDFITARGFYGYKDYFMSASKEEFDLQNKSKAITEYDGLKIGDKIPFTVINEWIKIGNNYHLDGWKTKTDPYSTDIGNKVFTIREFTINSNVVTVIPNKWLITEGFRAEGLKKFMDNYHKPAFEEGKWYKIMNNWYAKFKSVHASGSKWQFSEKITSTGDYLKLTDSINMVSQITLLDNLEEIQKYLPKGHPDELPVKSNTEFKVGDWVTILNTNIGPAEKILNFKETGLIGKIQTVLSSGSYNYKVHNIWCNVRKATVEEIIAVGGKPDINDVLEYCKQRYPVGTKYKCAWKQNDLNNEKVYTLSKELMIRIPERDAVFEQFTGYLYYKGKFAEIVESVKESCEMCGDTGKVLKAKLYPSGHTEEWEYSDKCDYHEPVDMRNLVTFYTEGNNTYGEFNYEEAIKFIDTNKTLDLPIVKKQSKNKIIPLVIQQEQKSLNLPIVKQIKKHK